jgi:hypothetical protein
MGLSMKIGDLLYDKLIKTYGVIVDTEDDINFTCCWYDDMVIRPGVHYANIMEHWREAQKLNYVNQNR